MVRLRCMAGEVDASLFREVSWRISVGPRLVFAI
jgi:hypothetical protein